MMHLRTRQPIPPLITLKAARMEASRMMATYAGRAADHYHTKACISLARLAMERAPGCNSIRDITMALVWPVAVWYIDLIEAE